MQTEHFIHIGRNKAASTTLQQFFDARRIELAAEGVDYFLWGAIAKAYPGAPGFTNSDDYAAHLAKRDSRSTLISSEDLLAYGPSYAGSGMLEALRSHPLRIIAYIRDYASWLTSQYAQVATGGFTTLSCDDFYLSERHGVSALPLLERWAEKTSWSALHVRSLDPAGLFGGNVVSDCANILGLAPHLAESHATSRHHTSPHWLCTEIMRHLRAANSRADAHTFIADVVQPLRPIVDAAIELEPNLPAKVHYWTAEQFEWLVARYNEDVAAISERIGVRIPAMTEQRAAHRTFIPSVKDAPDNVLKHILEAVAAPRFQTEHPQAAWNASYALTS